MKRANKRLDLIEIIIRKTGIVKGNSNSGYLTKEQLQALIIFVQLTENKIRSLTEEVKTLTEGMKLTYGKDNTRSCEP